MIEMSKDELTRQIILSDIQADSLGRNLTPEAQQRAVDFAFNLVGNSLSWGQLRDLGIKHVLK